MGDSAISAVRRLPIDKRRDALTLMVMMERMRQLPKEDVQDLIDLQSAHLKSTDQDERDEIMKLMEAIFVGDNQSPSEVQPLAQHKEHDANKRLAQWLGAQVAKFRKERGLSQTELGEAAGIPQSHVSRIENGVYYATELTRTKLAKALGIDPRKLDLTEG